MDIADIVGIAENIIMISAGKELVEILWWGPMGSFPTYGIGALTGNLPAI